MNNQTDLNSQREFYDTVFESITPGSPRFNCIEFQDCTFRNCDFSEVDFSNKTLVDCRFENCNLSMLKLNQATLNDVRFKNCKMLGIIFSDARDGLFSVDFEGCMLDYASFFSKKMIKSRFIRCNLREANFTQTNLTNAVFNECDLNGAIFRETNLNKADLSGAVNYVIDPELNNIKHARFSITGIEGLLTKHEIKVTY